MPYINWLYFFHAWGFPSRYGNIAHVHGCTACRQNWLQTFNQDEQPRVREAMKLYDEATALLKTLDGTFNTHARVLLLPAWSEGDDIVVQAHCRSVRLPMLRQQTPSQDGHCWCLSDFIRPRQQDGMPCSCGDDVMQGSQQDPYSMIGIFAATVDRDMEECSKDDDYRHLLHQTLADRLAEATAERLHEEVRTHLWGYAPDEHLTIEQLLSEQYQGRRPAVGYPSLPDQSINFLIDELLRMHDIGITLTESGAMRPHASTSGLMLAHPQSRHFSVGEITEEQRCDYARRRGLNYQEMEKFLPSMK